MHAGLLLPETEASQLQPDLLRTNTSGTMVAALASRRQDHRRDPRLFVLCTTGGGALHVYDFGTDELLPVAVTWDLQDPRILVVQAQVGGASGGACMVLQALVSAWKVGKPQAGASQPEDPPRRLCSPTTTPRPPGRQQAPPPTPSPRPLPAAPALRPLPAACRRR
jgi:hypothetical protein